MLKKIYKIIIFSLFFTSVGVIAGTFTPDPSSPGPSFYTLSDIYNKISSSTFSGVDQSVHSFNPAESPSNKFFTLTDIWNAIPPLKTLVPGDLNSGILPAGIYTATTDLMDIEPGLRSYLIATGTSIFGVVGRCAPPPLINLGNGLIGYWPGDNDTNDYSGNSNNASWTIGSQSYAAGKFSQAFSFNGAREVSLNMNNMPSQRIYSVSVWAKASQLNMRNGQMVGWGHDWSSDTFTLMIGGGDNYGDVSSNQLMVLNGYWKGTGYYLNDLNWHHFAATADGSSLKVYVDGVLVPNSLTLDGTMNSYFHLGHFPGGYYRSGESGAPFLRYYYGLVDETAIWNRALSESEILNLYNGGAGRTLN